MEVYRIIFYKRKLKAVPMRLKIVLVLMLLLCTVAALESLKSPTNWTKNVKQAELSIDEVFLWDSRDLTGSRYKIRIRSGDDNYYLWYSYSHADLIREYLLSGEISTVTVQYRQGNPVSTAIWGKRIVDCRSGDIVFYDIEDAVQQAKNDQIGAVVLLCLSLVIWIIATMWIFIVYGVVSW